MSYSQDHGRSKKRFLRIRNADQLLVQLAAESHELPSGESG